MKKLVIHPAKKLLGTLDIPGDKSISHRAVMLGSLAYGTTKVRHFLTSEDCFSTSAIFRAMGVQIEQKGDWLTIKGKGLNSLVRPQKTLDAGNSGTTARILMGLLAAQPFSCRVTGDKYLRRRPMKRVLIPLSKMGAQIKGSGGGEFLPVSIEGSKLKGITYELPVASAQVKSCLLLAGLFAEGKTTVREPLPTRDHTERMFKTFDIPFKKKGVDISVKGPIHPFRGKPIRVPGDISSAAFFVVAGLIVPGAQIKIRNVGINPTRTGLLDVLKKMGAEIEIFSHSVKRGEEPIADLVIRHSTLKGVEVGGALVPRMVDEFPAFAVAATQAKGTTLVKDAQDLKVKESDRIVMMALNLKKMGADIEATSDGWVIQGPTPLKGAKLYSGGDHRIAMSLAVAGLCAQGSTTILDTENIDTSFPGFEQRLKKIIVSR
jgi:3-phosphoshikimate 1-carboxyvinyltransferase